MEDLFQQEKKEPEYKDPNEEQGGIRRRLRDRDLLRKRKAEAEEKETNHEESPRKGRAGDSSGAKKRGRPRKAEPAQEISAAKEESAAAAPAVMVVSEAAQINPDQTFYAAVSAVESQPASVIAAPLSMFGPVQGSIPTPAPTSLTQSPTVLASAPIKAPNEGPIPVQDQTPIPAPDVPVLIQAPDPDAPPSADVVSLAALDEMKVLDPKGQVTIEDVGPDEEEDLSQNKGADEDLNEISTEQSKMPSAPSFSSPPPQQEYLPGNSL